MTKEDVLDCLMIALSISPGIACAVYAMLNHTPF